MKWQKINEEVEDGVYACRNTKEYEYGVYYRHQGQWCICWNKKQYIPLPPLKDRENIEILRIDI
jgi:hypothetical protein